MRTSGLSGGCPAAMEQLGDDLVAGAKFAGE